MMKYSWKARKSISYKKKIIAYVLRRIKEFPRYDEIFLEGQEIHIIQKKNHSICAKKNFRATKNIFFVCSEINKMHTLYFVRYWFIENFYINIHKLVGKRI